MIVLCNKMGFLRKPADTYKQIQATQKKNTVTSAVVGMICRIILICDNEVSREGIDK